MRSATFVSPRRSRCSIVRRNIASALQRRQRCHLLLLLRRSSRSLLHRLQPPALTASRCLDFSLLPLPFGLTFLHRLDLRPPLGFLASLASRCHTGLLIFSLHPPSSSITVRPFQISCIATCRSYPAGFRVVQADPHGFRIPRRNIHSLKRTARLTPRVAYTAALRLLLLLVDRNNADLDTLFYTIRALLIMVSDTT